MSTWDEYKFFAESTQCLSDRRQNATQTYIGVNTAIFVVIGFLIKDSGMDDWARILSTLPLMAVGALVCHMWRRIILQYKQLIGWRYDQLMALENQMPDCHKMYNREYNEFFKSRPKKFGFSILEKRLPELFMIIYGLYGLILVVAGIIKLL